MNRDKTGEIKIKLLRASDDVHENAPQYQAELQQLNKAFRSADVKFAQRGMAFDSIDAHGFALGDYLIQHIPEGAVGAIIGALGTWLQTKGGRRVRLKVGEIEAEAHTTKEVENLIAEAIAVQNYQASGSKEKTSASEHKPAQD